MTRRDVPGHLYLAHLDPPLKHARHYLGFAEGGLEDLAERLAEHGGPHGARLLQRQQEAGGTWHITRTWEGTRRLERAIKNTRHVPHYCPACQPERSAARREARGAGRNAERNPEMTQATDATITTAPETAQPGYWDLAGDRVRDVLSTNEGAVRHVGEIVQAQNLPARETARALMADREAGG